MFKKLLIIVAVATLTACSPAPLQNVSKASITKDPERICNSEGANCKYLVFTEGEVFENVDNRRYNKHNSSDLYAKIAKGKTCDFQVVGERNPRTSSYRNIITASCD